MNLITKRILITVFVFLVVLTLGIFSSTSYYYTKTIFIEKELMKKTSKIVEDVLTKWSESFLFTSLDTISNNLKTNYGEIVAPSGTPENDIELIKSSLDNVYLQFKTGTFSESKSCEEGYFAGSKEDCEFVMLSSFTMNLAISSIYLLSADSTHGVVSKKVQRIDEQVAKILTLAQDFAYHGMLAFWSNSHTTKILESCKNNITDIGIEERKEKFHNCLVKALNDMELKADNLVRDLKFTNLNIPDCAQYLPLIEAKNLERHLINRLDNVKNPYLRFYYGVMAKNLNRCSYEVFENLKVVDRPCYKPESISLTIKSIESVMGTSGGIAFCMNDAIKNETSD